VPTKKEMSLLSSWKGDASRLGKVELYIKALSIVPYLSIRLHSMIFQLNFDEIYNSIITSINKITIACQDLRNSDKFVRLLGIILEIGNSLNKGTNKGGAKGIQLSSLMKLTQTRTNSGATLLEYIVVHIKKKCPDLLKLDDDLESLDSATKVSLETIRLDVNKMKIGCTNIMNGIELDQKENNSQLFHDAMNTFLQRANHLKEDVITQINNVDHEFESLCSYFAAPPPPATSPDTFFELVNSFVKTFSSTVKQVDEKIVSFFHFQFLSTVSIF
jgi:hypothetical protein